MSGVDLIVAERQRQLDVEGWSSEHDDAHNYGEIASAAGAYVTLACHQIYPDFSKSDFEKCAEEAYSKFWAWDDEWWKPSENPIRNLEKAGALIAAEIDRLQRASEKAERESITADTLLERFTNLYGETPLIGSMIGPGRKLWRDYYEFSGNHMILTDEGWEPGENKQSYLDDPDWSDDAILDEVNAPLGR